MRVRVAGICGLSVTSQQQKRGHAPPFPIRDSCRACKPNSVCRSFSPTDSLPPKEGGRTGHPPPLNAGGDKERHGDHSSRPYIAARLQRPTRKLWRTEPARLPRRAVLPYLVLLRVGFSLPPPLLAARCALTAPFHPYPDCSRRYLFCGTFRKRPLKAAPRTLSGTPLCGVRTFLSPPAQPELPAEAGPPKWNDQCPQTGSDRPTQQLTEPL